MVGIGYPTDNWDEVRRRRYDDLSPWPLDPAILALAAPGIAKTGGGDAFLRFIEEDVKPFVAARFKVDLVEADSIRIFVGRSARSP